MSRSNWVAVPLLCVFVWLAMASSSRGQLLLQDNFDSYADQAAFLAAWPTTGVGPSQLSTDQAYSPIQSVQLQTTAARNARSFAETAATASDFLTFSFRFYDSNAAAAAYRQYSEVIDSPGTANGQIVAMGLNNNISSTFYMARLLGSDGGSGISAFFRLDDPGAPARSTGWHELKAVVMPTFVDFYVDDVLSKTVPLIGTGQGRSYDTVRIGSNLSAALSAHVDDISVVVTPVPEPASSVLAICGVGAAIASTLRKRLRRNIAA